MTFARVSSREKLERILRGSKAAIVVFTSSTCPACSLYRPVVEKLGELVDIPVVEYLVDFDPDPAVELGILGTPATVVYIDGEPVEGFIGAVDLPDLAEFATRVLKGRVPEVAKRLERIASGGRGLLV